MGAEEWLNSRTVEFRFLPPLNTRLLGIQNRSYLEGLGSSLVVRHSDLRDPSWEGLESSHPTS